MAQEIKSPKHYCFGKYEPRKVIRDWGLNFNLGCSIKYIVRAGRKDGNTTLEDLLKAREYLDFEIEAIKEDEADIKSLPFA